PIYLLHCMTADVAVRKGPSTFFQVSVDYILTNDLFVLTADTQIQLWWASYVSPSPLIYIYIALLFPCFVVVIVRLNQYTTCSGSGHSFGQWPFSHMGEEANECSARGRSWIPTPVVTD